MLFLLAQMLRIMYREHWTLTPPEWLCVGCALFFVVFAFAFYLSEKKQEERMKQEQAQI